MYRSSLAVLILGSVVGCGGGGSGDSDGSGGSGSGEVVVTPPAPGERLQNLAEWNLFADGPNQEPASRVVPYTVNARLFSDYAVKARFVWVPEGTTIGYEDENKWRMPVGTILVKTFAYPEDLRAPDDNWRLLETRLLVRETEQQWKAHTYVWNEEQTEALRTSAGDTIASSWVHTNGETRNNDYGVPENNLCEKCHGAAEKLDTLGGRTRQLNGPFDYGDGPENQIDHLAALGMFDREPPPADQRETLVDPFGTAPVSDRARAYLDANCAHCHSPESFAGSVGFLLDYASTDPVEDDPTNWGVCKVPASAGPGACGLSWDVLPGDPAQSIIVCRMESRDIAIQMPPLASKIADDEGVQLMREWIASMPATTCQ